MLYGKPKDKLTIDKRRMCLTGRKVEGFPVDKTVIAVEEELLPIGH